MNKKAVNGILIGYDNNDGYRVWCKKNKILIRSHDVPFDKIILSSVNMPTIPSDSNQRNDQLTQSQFDTRLEGSVNRNSEEYIQNIEIEMRMKHALKKK